MIFNPCQSIEIQDKVKIIQDQEIHLELARSLANTAFLKTKVKKSRYFLLIIYKVKSIQIFDDF